MRKLAACASVAAGIAVACGAFGAHALRDRVPAVDLLIWEKAVLYHFLHAIAAWMVALVASTFISQRWAARICILFLASICVFSGSLYLLVLLDQRWLGMITPLGGTGFIIGWLALAAALWSQSSES